MNADSLVQGLAILLQPTSFGMLFLGVCMGLFLGAVPGLSGTVGLAIILSLIFGMPLTTVLPMMIGVYAATATGDTVPAVLFGTPGDVAATATIMDGYPLAKRGQAARVLGASFSASMLGGIFGAIVLTLSIPIARPLLRQFLSPEFFMLCLLGVALVGGLTGKAPLKGIFAGTLGLLLATIGGAPGVGHYRFTFDLVYLYTGIPLIVMALGVMALPEIVDIFIKGTRIASAERTYVGGGLVRGYIDTFRNWWLVIRSSLIGAWVGFIPALGGAAAAWMAYSHAVASTKGPMLDRQGQVIDGYHGRFGQGDMRGVIAPESSNNAVRGGALIPTLFFGIPGSSAMAILLMAMLVIGIQPGSAMMDPSQNLPLTYSIIWSLAIANIMATLICSFLARPMACLTTINVHYLVPFIMLFVIFGGYQATNNWGDLIALALLGSLGWTMKRLGWPRPPLLVGFVLGGLADKYLYLTVQVFDIIWLWRPWVLGIFAAIIVSLWFIIRATKKEKKTSAAVAPAGKGKANWTFKKGTIFTLLMVAVSAFVFQQTTTFPLGSGLYPMVIAIICVGLAVSQVIVELRQKTLVTETMDVAVEETQKGKEAMQRAKRWVLWFLGIYAGVFLVGMQYSIVGFFLLFMWLEGHLKWWRIILLTAIVAFLVFWLFTDVLNMEWQRGLLQEWLYQR